MQRRALLTLLFALGAAAAFAVGAAAFDDVVSGTDSTVDGDDGPTESGSGGGTKDRGATRGGGSAAGGCLVCGLSARSLVGSLLPAVSPLLLVGLAAAVVAGAALLGLRPDRDRTPPVDESDDGAARSGDAGRSAATGPPDAAVTNEVYRAWAALADRVDVGAPETTTPGEYAESAVDAGLNRAAVERLTGLFEAVRYGDAPVTDERERTARTTAERLTEGDERTEHGEEDEAS